MKKHRYIDTLWEVWTYDVWGNEKDGFEVNDRYCQNREYPLRLRVETANEGTPQAFDYASPTDKQLRDALDIKPRVKIETDGDDLTVYVNATRDDYPCGELHCISHESLSPIREKELKAS